MNEHKWKSLDCLLRYGSSISKEVADHVGKSLNNSPPTNKQSIANERETCEDSAAERIIFASHPFSAGSRSTTLRVRCTGGIEPGRRLKEKGFCSACRPPPLRGCLCLCSRSVPKVLLWHYPNAATVIDNFLSSSTTTTVNLTRPIAICR
jgi:hypothetical protein